MLLIGKLAMALGGIIALGVGLWSPLRQDQQPKVRVLMFLDTDCPIAQAYAPRLNRLIGETAPQGVEFHALFPNDGESDGKIRTYLNSNGYSFGWSYDAGALKAKSYKLAMVPAFVVLGERGNPVYSGAFDDNKNADLARTPYLGLAIHAALAGARPLIAKTEPIGCLLQPGAAPVDAAKVNYSEHVAPILNDHCVSCHRPGQAAPFSLIGYDNAKSKANMIAYVTQRGTMPPWKAVPGYGEFHDENTLPPAKRETLDRWAKAGAPRGDASKAPREPSYEGDWPLGAPDRIVKMPKRYKVYAEGHDIYRHFVIDPQLTEPKWVTAMDVRPGNRRVVHHVILFMDKTDASAKLEAGTKDGQPGYTTFGGPGFIPAGSLGGWAPGLQARHLPPGVAFRLDPGMKLVMEVHYHPTGKEEIDQTEVGLYFADEPAKTEVDIAWLLDGLLRLPPDRVTSWKRRFPISQDTTLYMAMPHMHLLGQSMKAWAVMPDGSEKPLIWVDQWDFNWQLTYGYKEPVKLPAGCTIFVEAVFDNTKSNVNNPNSPPRRVTWGEETTDEMFLLVLAFAGPDGKSRGTRYMMGRP